MSKTICFTGRRPKDLFGYYNYDAYKEIQDVLSPILETHYTANGVRNAISGGAQGFDQLAFWTVHTFSKKHPDMKNTVYIPFYGQDGRWTENGLFGRNEYRRMLSLADEVKYVRDMLPNGDRYNIPALLIKRNEAMVDDADIVIALYPFDMDWKTMSGGTANCMRYAHRNHKPIQQIDPFTKQVRWV